MPTSAPTTLDTLTSDIQNYVVAPLNMFGVGGFVFDVEGESTTQLQAEITDHFVENNEAVQDHIARKPRSITLKGYQGEVIYQPQPDATGEIIQQVVQKLTIVSSFLPAITSATKQAQAIIEGKKGVSDLTLTDAADLFGLVKNVIGSFTSETPRQQQAYLYFKALWQTGTLVAIQTPWEFLTNMAVETVIAMQPEETRYITDFSVKFKQIRFAQTKSKAYNSNKSANSANPDENEANAAIVQKPAPVIPVTGENLQGASALQAPNPVSIGNIPSIALPTTTLPGAQQFMVQASDLLSNPGIRKIFTNAIPAPPAPP